MAEDYVSFEVAKLLKEKGFDWCESPFYSEQDRDEWRQNNSYTVPNEEYDTDLPFDSETLTLMAPHVSIQTAMKWLREVHKLYIEIGMSIDLIGKPHFNYSIVNKDGKYFREGCTSFEWEYEKACEAAIKYCLENLV